MANAVLVYGTHRAVSERLSSINQLRRLPRTYRAAKGQPIRATQAISCLSETVCGSAPANWSLVGAIDGRLLVWPMVTSTITLRASKLKLQRCEDLRGCRKATLLSKVAIADKGIWIGLFGSGEHAGGHIARVQNDY